MTYEDLPRDNGAANTEEAAQILWDLSDKDPVSREARFASLLADRLKTSTTNPQAFVLLAAIAVNDVKTGIDSYTERPIERYADLLDLPDLFYDELLGTTVPKLASLAFSESFGNEVHSQLVSLGLAREESLDDFVAPDAEDTENY